jgi:hypothetical protein
MMASEALVANGDVRLALLTGYGSRFSMASSSNLSHGFGYPAEVIQHADVPRSGACTKPLVSLLSNGHDRVASAVGGYCP